MKIGRFFVVPGVLVCMLLLSGCGAFWRWIEIDNYTDMAAQAQVLSKNQPTTFWEVTLTEGDDETDFIEFIDGQRVLVGTLEVYADDAGGIHHRRIALYNVGDGKLLWQHERPRLPSDL